MTTQGPHPRCLYLDIMLRLSIPLSTLVPALIQLAAVSTTPVGGSNESIRLQHLAILYQFADQGPTLQCLHTPDSLICCRHVEYCGVSLGSESRIYEFSSGKFRLQEVRSPNYEWETGASRQHPQFPSWKNMAAAYDLEGKILQSVYLTVFATTGKQHFS